MCAWQRKSGGLNAASQRHMVNLLLTSVSGAKPIDFKPFCQGPQF
jgi:hypothetical protein